MAEKWRASVHTLHRNSFIYKNFPICTEMFEVIFLVTIRCCRDMLVMSDFACRPAYYHWLIVGHADIIIISTFSHFLWRMIMLYLATQFNHLPNWIWSFWGFMQNICVTQRNTLQNSCFYQHQVFYNTHSHTNSFIPYCAIQVCRAQKLQVLNPIGLLQCFL